MKKFLVASVVTITIAAVSAWAQEQGIAQWTFETSAPTTAGPISPEHGSGQAYAVGISGLNAPAGDIDPNIAAMAPTFTSPAGATPSVHSYSGNGWAVGTSYWEFEVSTVGDTSIEVGWDQASSNTGPGNFSLYANNALVLSYTVPANYSGGAVYWNQVSTNALSEIVSEPGTAWDNQSTLTFQLIDESTTSASGGTVGSGGTDRVDNFTVVGIPEPSTVALVVSGLVGLLALRRRRS